MGYATAAAALVLGAACAVTPVQAGEPHAPFDQHPGSFQPLAQQNGFIVGLCRRDRGTLLEELRYQRTRLESRRAALRTAAGNGTLNAGDIALTMLLPGGLLYAAHRQQSMQRARHDLVRVEARLDELSAALRSFSLPQPTLSARAD